MNECTAVAFGLVTFSITLLIQQQGIWAMSKVGILASQRALVAGCTTKMPLPWSLNTALLTEEGFSDLCEVIR